LKLPGFEYEYNDRSQNQVRSTNPPASVSENIVVDSTLNNDSIRILATLWKYQTERYGTDYSTRWTFNIFPNAPAYPNYLNGLAELVRLGLVSVVPENNQVLLTNHGIEYINQNPNIKSNTDIYRF